MGNATLFASKLLIKQSMITMNTNLMMSCNDKCIFYMRFFEQSRSYNPEYYQKIDVQNYFKNRHCFFVRATAMFFCKFCRTP